MKREGDIADAESLFMEKLADEALDPKPDDAAEMEPIEDKESIGMLSDWTENIKNSIKEGNSKLHGASPFYIQLNEKVDQLAEYMDSVKNRPEESRWLSPYEYSAFLAKYEEVIEASKAYLTHVDDVKAEKGRNSKTQIRRKGLVEQALEKAQDAKEKTRLNIVAWKESMGERMRRTGP